MRSFYCNSERDKKARWRERDNGMRSLKELMNMTGRVALVTGAGGHIGKECVDVLAELGSHVALMDLAGESCVAQAKRIEQVWGGRALAVVTDLAQEQAVRSGVRKVLEAFGRLDVVINCAAYVGTTQLKGWTTPFVEQSTETWRAALEVNLTAPFVLVQECTDALRQSGHGSIINIGSTYGIVGPDLRLYEGTTMGNPAAYAASKGGLIQLTRWLATVLAPNVRVNAISPGGVWRNQPEAFVERYVARTPLRRMASEEDLKGAVAYLASDLSNYVTGQHLLVDGGWTAW